MRYRSIRFKLIYSFVAVILLPLLTLGVLGPYISAATVETEITKHTAQLIQQVSKNVEQSITKMEGIITIVAENPDVRAFFGLNADPFTGENETGAHALLTTISKANPEIAGILIVNHGDRSLSNEMVRVSRDSLLGETWYRKATQDPRLVQLLPRPVGRNLRNLMEYSADDVVSIAKAVPNPRGGPCSGVVLIDMKLEVVRDFFKDLTVGLGGFLFIEDPKGEIVYAPVNDVVYRVRTEWLSNAGAAGVSLTRKIRGADYQIIAKGSEYTGWKTIGVFPMNEIMRQVGAIRYYSLIIGGVTVIFAFLASIFFSGSIARPVIRLRALMKEAEEGNLAVRFEGRQDDEISHLGKSFNAMLEEIQKLIDMVYREQQSKREAELKTLQEQIKPHFLYNTLDTIQWMAQDHGAEDIVRIVGALTSLFRIALSKGKEMIPLSDELEHVKSYLIIQKARYEDKFDFSIRVEEEVLAFMVLKLTLQPLVENAIYHGVKERRGHGKIALEALRRDGTLVLRVTDDGVGMSAKKLASIRAQLATPPLEGPVPRDGYGISNVNERIQLSFGRKYGLSFESAPGRGTVVELLHPLVREEE